MRVVPLLALAAAVGCGKAPRAKAPAAPGGPPAAAAPDPARFRQSFAAATTATAPADALPPPDRTLAGKPTAPLAVAVRKAWDGITFAEADGKPVPVRVAVATAAGDVEITLFPDLAPNHVRNFLALARVGFYDGLVFERVVKQEMIATGGPPTRLDFVTAGCPAGDGAPGLGHLGYFLKPEFNDLRHDEGTVGFWRGDDDASAGTRFYVTLGAAPLLDGKYTAVGRVSRGMNVLHKIAEGKLREPDLEQPENPVAIRAVTVATGK